MFVASAFEQMHCEGAATVNERCDSTGQYIHSVEVEIRNNYQDLSLKLANIGNQLASAPAGSSGPSPASLGSHAGNLGPRVRVAAADLLVFNGKPKTNQKYLQAALEAVFNSSSISGVSAF